jgi:hypothetical protein
MSWSSNRWSARRPINWRRHQGWVSAINCSSWRRLIDGVREKVGRGDARYRHLAGIHTYHSLALRDRQSTRWNQGVTRQRNHRPPNLSCTVSLTGRCHSDGLEQCVSFSC